MISKIQDGMFKYLSDIFDQYSIPIEFRYNEDLDLLNEFRKSVRLRIEGESTYNRILEEFQSESKKLIHNLALFTRGPIVRDSMRGNNAQLNVWVKELEDAYSIEVRNSYFAEISYNVKILFDNHESADLCELIYGYQLANKHRSFLVDYKVGDHAEPIEGVPYDIYFSDIEDIGSVNSSNLRYLGFSFKINGLVLTPFYVNKSRIEFIELKLLTYGKNSELNPSDMDKDKYTIRDTTLVTQDGKVKRSP